MMFSSSSLAAQPLGKKRRRRLLLRMAVAVIIGPLFNKNVNWTLSESESHDSFPTVVQKQQPLPLINRWQSRGLNRPDKGGYLFFKHIRKAGGTTLYAYLERVMQYHHALAQQNSSSLSISYYEQESHAMDWRCPQVDDRWNDTLSIISLRHPIER